MGTTVNTAIFQQETSQHKAAVEALLDRAFGPGRFTKTAERLRENNQPIAKLCRVAFEDGKLHASVRFWPIMIGSAPALLLGPLAVEPGIRGNGLGLALMKDALAIAKTLPGNCVVLVGDEPYYAKVGFKRAKPGSLFMPGPVDQTRLLMLCFDESKAPPKGKVSVPLGTS